MPFMGFAAGVLTFTGASRAFSSPAAGGGAATRNFCSACGSLVFGGERDFSDSFTVYAGSLDDPSLFQPTIAIFTAGSPAWAAVPAHLKVFARSPH
jgi:hypothetical protein